MDGGVQVRTPGLKPGSAENCAESSAIPAQYGGQRTFGTRTRKSP